jgi:hypothetical protein
MLVEELIVFHQQASIHIETTVAYVSLFVWLMAGAGLL